MTEDALVANAMVLGAGTFGAVRLEDLRRMPVMVYVRTLREYSKMQRARENA